MTPRKKALLAAMLALVLGGIGMTSAAFVASSNNDTNTFAAAVDWASPGVQSINRADANPTNATTLHWTVTFDEPVSGVDASDFQLSESGGVSGASITGVSGSGTTYTVTADAGSNEGSLGLDLVDDDSIQDSGSNKLGGVGAGNGNLTGQAYSIDRTAPSLTALQMLDTDGNGKVDQVKATFDGTLASSTSTAPWTLANVPSGGTLSSVSTSGSVATLTLAEGAGAANTSVGSFTVALAGSASGIRDDAGNESSFAAQAPTDGAAPIVASIDRHTASPTSASSVQFDITLSESVTGVGTSDFQLAASGVTGSSITGITGSGASYAVTANTGSGSGSLGLNLVDDDSIADGATNKLGGTGTGNGNFTGQAYTIDRTSPTVVSLNRHSASPTNAASVQFDVTFSESVTGVDTADFTRVASGVSGSAITGVTGSGASYTVTVSTGSNSGSLGLNLTDNDTIVDGAGNPLGGTGAGNGNFTGQVYTIDKASPSVSSISRADSTPTNGTTLHWTVTFSESVTGVDTADFQPAQSGGVTSASVTGVSGSGTTYTVTVDAGSNDGTLGLNLVDDDSIADGATNKLGGTGTGNGNFTGQTYTIDRTAPALTTLQMFDTNTNGKVDQVKATFDGTLASSTSTAPWTLANVPSGGTLSSVSTSGSVATLTISEGAGAPDTAVGSFTVALAQSSSGIRDATGNQSSFSAQAPADKATPDLTALQMLDVDGNGKVDRVTATFSEPLASSTSTSPWTLTSIPSSGTFSGVSTSGAVATLAIAEGGGTPSTAVGSFTVALSSSSSGIRDAADNRSSFSTQAPQDAASPVVRSLNRVGTDPTNAASLQWTATFTESVSGVGTSDFQVAQSGGVSGASVTGVSGSGSTYTVTASAGSNDGSLGLDLVDDDSIQDSATNKLGGGGTGNGNVTGQVYTIDRTAPSLTGLQMFDSNGNGKVDQVTATFNESLASSTATAPWTLTNVPSGGTLSSVSTSGAVATLAINEGAGAANTAVGSFTVALATSSSGIRDATGNQSSFAAQAPQDGAAPTVVSLNRADSDPTNATTVHWTATLSEPVTGVDASDFALSQSGGVSGASITGVSGSGTTYTVTAGAGSNDGSLGVNLVDDDSIEDSASNKLGGTGTGNGNSTGQVYTIDRAAPTLTSLQMFDTDANGKVDQVKATFSESLASSTATAPWTLTNIPSAGTFASVSTSGAVATLAINEGAGAANTAVGSFTVALAQSSSGIRDAAGNQASFAAQAPADKAGPVPISLTDTNGATDGKFEQNDTMTVTFSEPVTGVGASSNLVLTGGSGSGGSSDDSITIPGLLGSLTSLNRSDYISTNGSIANFNASALSQPTTSQVRVTLAACSGACANLTQAAGTGSFTFAPATNITDAASNPGTGSLTVTIRLF